MKAGWLVTALTLGLAAPAAGQSIHLKAGATMTDITDLDAPYDGAGSGTGYTLGADLRFGKLITIQPGFHLQRLAFEMEDEANDLKDGVGLGSFQIPVTVGIGIDLKVVALRVFAGPALTVVTSVGDNDFAIEKSALHSTMFSGLIGVEGKVLFLDLFVSREAFFSDVFQDPAPSGTGKLGTTRFGIGFGF
jgi:hypothetical protein